MSTEELERKIQEKIESVKKKTDRYDDRHVIEMVMSHYVMRDNPRNMERNLEFFALDEADVSIEWGDLGKFVGAEKVELFLKTQGARKYYQGIFRMRWLATPMIEVAKDGQTAKCVWICPGAESVVDDNGHCKALWNFVRFANDFKKDSAGMWRIWHLRMFVDVRCEYEKGWCNDFVKYVYLGKQPGSEAVEPTWHNPCSPSFVQEDIPSCPARYDTWTDESWIFTNQPLYAPPQKT